MKKYLCGLLALLVALTFCACSADGNEDQGTGTASGSTADSNLGDYQVEILGCRLAKTYDDKAAVIVKYKFTNNSDEAANFMFAFDETVYQDGIGLNQSYFMDDSANYDSGNQTKDIKTGASIEVEVAYELNDTTTDIEVEVEELISFSDKKITKTFKIAE
jgi:hypothetical protein